MTPAMTQYGVGISEKLQHHIPQP